MEIKIKIIEVNKYIITPLNKQHVKRREFQQIKEIWEEGMDVEGKQTNEQAIYNRRQTDRKKKAVEILKVI